MGSMNTMRTDPRSLPLPGVVAVILALALAHGAACDSTAQIGRSVKKLEGLSVVSSAPLVETADGVRKACQAGPDDRIVGVELGFVLMSTKLKENDPDYWCSGAQDQDRAIRPGDKVEALEIRPGDTLTANSFELAVDCVEPYPDPDRVTARECQGVSTPDFEITEMGFREFYEETDKLPVRCEPAAIVVLVDQSGSTRGLVEADNGYREGTPGTFPAPPDSDRVRVASDPTNTRLAATVDFINRLNANDELIVWGFNERLDGDNIQVLCETDPPEGTEEEYIRRSKECFGINRTPIEDAVATAFGEEEGRTPLWDAVKAAYDFLNREDVDAPRNRHIVVIGDGPDTCAAGSVEWEQTGRPQCGFGTSFEEARDAIVAGNAEPGAVPVHVHFVQLGSRAYPDRDGRQMELACLTDGHYQFVNGTDFPRTDAGEPTEALGLALSEAMARVRFSLVGYWTMRTETAAFDVAAGQLGELEPGHAFGLGGTLSLLPDPEGRGFTQVRVSEIFDESGVGFAPWDLRVSFRRACLEDADCGAPPGPCQILCNVGAGMCYDTAVNRPDGTECTTDASEPGECCAGACQAGTCE